MMLKSNRYLTDDGFRINGRRMFRMPGTQAEKTAWFQLLDNDKLVRDEYGLRLKKRLKRSPCNLVDSFTDLSFSQYPHKKSWKYHTKNKKQWNKK